MLIGGSLLLRYHGDVDYEYRPEIISVLRAPKSRSEQGSEESRREFESSVKGRETPERKGVGSYFANRCLSKGSKEWNLKEKEQRIERVESIDRRTVKEGIFPPPFSLLLSVSLSLSLLLSVSLSSYFSRFMSPKVIFAHGECEDAGKKAKPVVATKRNESNGKRRQKRKKQSRKKRKRKTRR